MGSNLPGKSCFLLLHDPFLLHSSGCALHARRSHHMASYAYLRSVHAIVPAETNMGLVPMADASASTDAERGRPPSVRYSRRK